MSRVPFFDYAAHPEGPDAAWTPFAGSNDHYEYAHHESVRRGQTRRIALALDALERRTRGHAPEQSGPMCRAWREVTTRLRAMAWQTLHDDAAAQRAAARHRAKYPRAYRPATPSTVPHESSVLAAGTGWDHDRMAFGALLRDDVTGTGVTLYDVVMGAEHAPRGPITPRLAQSWHLDRWADEIILADEMSAWLGGHRYMRQDSHTDDQGRTHHYVTNTRPSLAIRRHMDVWSRDHRQMQTNPDRVAFRGTVRVRNARRGVTFRRIVPTFVRGANGGLIETTAERVIRIVKRSHFHHSEPITAPSWAASARLMLETCDPHAMADAATIGNVPDVTTWKVSHYVTTIHHPDRDVTLIGAPGMAGSYGTRETVRHDTTPRRPVGRPLVSLDSGSVLGPWDMARTNLARECDRRGVLALAASIRARLDAAADGVTVALSVGSHEVIREGRRVRALGDDTSYPIAEYARRAALAGRPID